MLALHSWRVVSCATSARQRRGLAVNALRRALPIRNSEPGPAAERPWPPIPLSRVSGQNPETEYPDLDKRMGTVLRQLDSKSVLQVGE